MCPEWGADVVKNSTTGKLELAVMCGLGGCNEDTAKWQVCLLPRITAVIVCANEVTAKDGSLDASQCCYQ